MKSFEQLREKVLRNVQKQHGTMIDEAGVIQIIDTTIIETTHIIVNDVMAHVEYVMKSVYKEIKGVEDEPID